MARPRQQYRCADDLARWPRHAAGADARSRVLRRIPSGAARLWCSRQRVAVALPDGGDEGRAAAAGRYWRRWRGNRARISEPADRRAGDADNLLLHAIAAYRREDQGVATR